MYQVQIVTLMTEEEMRQKLQQLKEERQRADIELLRKYKYL